MTCHINTKIKIIERSLIKYPQIRTKPSNLYHKIHQIKTLTIKTPNTIQIVSQILSSLFLHHNIIN